MWYNHKMDLLFSITKKKYEIPHTIAWISPIKHESKRRKPRRKDYILYNSVYTNVLVKRVRGRGRLGRKGHWSVTSETLYSGFLMRPAGF